MNDPYTELLREAGLDTIPGTAAEILDDEIRKIMRDNLRTLAGLAPTLANAGTVPFLLSADLDGETNINAAVGQYLNMFELNAYGRVVLFATALLDSGDFPL